MAADNYNAQGIIVTVAVDKTLYCYDFLYDYFVPADMAEKAKPGRRVLVPFGKGNRRQIAMIFSVRSCTAVPEKIKPVSAVLTDGIDLSEELLELVRYLKENTFCTYFDAVRTVLPSGLNFVVRAQYELTPSDKPVGAEEKALLETLKAAGSSRELDAVLSSAAAVTANALISAGYLSRTESAKRRIGDETERMVRLCEDYDKNDRMAKLSPKQRAVIAALAESEAASVKELCYLCGVTAVVVGNLVKYGILEEYELELSRAVTAGAVATRSPSDIILSPAQQTVFDGLTKLLSEDKPECALLRGVTGSGKTSVFIRLIDETVRNGKTALMLVPEISLTPQMVGQFQSLFGDRVAIIHSALSIGQRADEYKRINSGEARIVIGTRSAVFAPLENIGVIVIDEEGEHTYKSEKAPRYHARNVAKQRCFKHNALLLLASATPSLDSFYNAQIGKYKLFTLEERYKNAVLPEVYIVDMKAEAESGNRGNFSEALLHELGENLRRGEQSLLLLNRRGYHTYASCIACGAVIECPNCNIPLTYHKANESVICHYCGFTEPMPDKCPKCGSKYIHQSGTGTQRIEDEIGQYFPTARVLRMDADTTMTKNAFETKFGQFGRGDYDIMVGTQMIAKGLDFDNVTLVGVLQIDKSLYAGDYLSYERTFSLVTQVVGRSGRGDKKGRAYIQTFTPEHYVIQLAAAQDYNEFYEQEIDIRKALIYPPFCDICLVGFSALSEKDCRAGAESFLALFAERLKKESGTIPVRALGPTKSGTGRMGGRYRYKLVIKCRMNKGFRALMNDVLTAAYKDRSLSNVSFYIDINGEII